MVHLVTDHELSQQFRRGAVLRAYRRSGYAEKIVAERIGGTQAGWGS